MEARQKYFEQMAETKQRVENKLSGDRARSAQVFVTNRTRKEINECGGDVRTLLAVSKNLHMGRRGTRNMKKNATIDLGKSESPPQTTAKAETPASASNRRLTFDEQATRSFAENPNLYKKKISEYKKNQSDELNNMMDQIQSRFVTAAQTRYDRTQMRLQDARKLLGDPEKVKDVKSSLD